MRNQSKNHKKEENSKNIEKKPNKQNTEKEPKKKKPKNFFQFTHFNYFFDFFLPTCEFFFTKFEKLNYFQTFKVSHSSKDVE